MTMLTAQGIRKSLNGRQILEPSDISLQPGKITVMLGPNGAGKSTMLRCLSFVDPPDAGSITIDGVKTEFPVRGSWSRPWPRVTAVFQGLHLWPHLTVKQNILLPRRARLLVGSNPEALQAAVHQFALEELLNRFPSQLSGGQRLLVALCRAVILQPEYLLLDEPTASLDIQSIHRLTEYLRALAISGKAIFVVTHMLGFASKVADEILFLDGGRVIERGSVDLLAHPSTPSLQTFVSLY